MTFFWAGLCNFKISPSGDNEQYSPKRNLHNGMDKQVTRGYKTLVPYAICRLPQETMTLSPYAGPVSQEPADLGSIYIAAFFVVIQFQCVKNQYCKSSSEE